MGWAGCVEGIILKFVSVDFVFNINDIFIPFDFFIITIIYYFLFIVKSFL
jgi:hypothetical protein